MPRVWSASVCVSGCVDHDCCRNVGTQAGFANWVAVGEVVFQFLAILRGITRPPSWVYQEVAKMARQRYNYGDDEDPNDQVVRLASNMVSGVIPPAGASAVRVLHDVKSGSLRMCAYVSLYLPDTLTATSLHGEEFNPEEVTELMALLTVDRVHVDLMSSKFKHDEVRVVSPLPLPLRCDRGVGPFQTLDRTEPWFGTKYCTSALPEDVVAAWREPKACPSLGLPCPNPFLPSNLTVLPLVTRLDPKLLEVATDGCGGPVPRRFRVPVRIHHDDTGKLWWHQDRVFRLPRGNVHYFLYVALPPRRHGRHCRVLVLIVHTAFGAAIAPSSRCRHRLRRTRRCTWPSSPMH